MQNPILIKNADLYAPEHVGARDILMAGGKIIAVAPSLEPNIPGLETIDVKGRKVIPGLIDQHIHVTGGGGEGGWNSRCPELNFSELVAAGVTTFLGVSGTDSMSRSIENLLAKVRGLTVEGATGWMWTSNYAYPPVTITDSSKMDMFAIPEVLGVKIAMGDHRSSHPSYPEILRLLSEIRVAGMLTGKTGFLHVHCGDWADDIFPIFFECRKHGIPFKHMRPTHVGREKKVFESACAFAKEGGYMDITTGGGNCMGDAKDALLAALAAGVPLEQITLSSDGQGSMPRFDEKGERVGFGVGSIRADIETLQALVPELGVEKAILPMTKTIATALGLPGKGAVATGFDADLLVMNEGFDFDWVFMKGVPVMREGEVVKKGAFEL